jgi:two-component system response regulator YesN
MEKAKWYLQNTDLDIISIAYQIGFNDSNYFSRIFKKKFGIPPMEFRRQAAK